jgi:hypothetical protein
MVVTARSAGIALCFVNTVVVPTIRIMVLIPALAAIGVFVSP